MHNNLQDALLKLDHATSLDDNREVLVHPLSKHLGQLARQELIGSRDRGGSQWWDHHIAIVASRPAPMSSIVNERTVHKPRLLAALPTPTANPHASASNADVENKIRKDPNAVPRQPRPPVRQPGAH